MSDEELEKLSDKERWISPITIEPSSVPCTRPTRGSQRQGPAPLKFKVGENTPLQIAVVLDGANGNRGTKKSRQLSHEMLKKHRWTLAGTEYSSPEDPATFMQWSETYSPSSAPESKVSFGSLGNQQTPDGRLFFHKPGTYLVRLCLGQAGLATLDNLAASADASSSQSANLAGTVQTIRSKQYAIEVQEPTLLDADSLCIVDPPESICRGVPVSLTMAIKRGDRCVVPTEAELAEMRLVITPTDDR